MAAVISISQYLYPEGEFYARVARPGDYISPLLKEGFEYFTPDPNWMWLAFYRGEPVAAMYVAPGHGIAIFMRICMLAHAPKPTLVRLLRKVLDDCDKRGYKGYMVCLDTSRPEEAQLLKIVHRAKGRIFGSSVIVGGTCNYKQFPMLGGQ